MGAGRDNSPLKFQRKNGVARNPAGRPRGSANLRSRKIANEIMEDETRISPLEFQIKVLNGHPVKVFTGDGPDDFEMFYPSFDDMKWAATNAAPFIHPKLNAHVVKETEDDPLVIQIVKFTEIDAENSNTPQLEAKTVPAKSLART